MPPKPVSSEALEPANPFFRAVRAGTREVFTAAEGQDAKRWLTKLVRDLRLDGLDTPEDFIEEFNCSLGGDPAHWANNDFGVKDILKKTEGITEEDVTTIKREFLETWYEEDEETDDVVTQIEALKQAPDETLRAYYLRTAGLLRQTHTEDSERATGSAKSLLELTTKRFSRGLHHAELRLRMNRIPAPERGQVRTLKNTWEKAQTCMRQIESEEEMLAAIRKDEELEMLRKMASVVATGATLGPEMLEKVRAYTGVELPTLPILPRSAPPGAAGPSRPPAWTAPERRVTFDPVSQISDGGQAGLADKTRTAQSAMINANPWQMAKDSVQAKHVNFEPTHSPNLYVSGGDSTGSTQGTSSV